jgi:hypothetical protein
MELLSSRNPRLSDQEEADDDDDSSGSVTSSPVAAIIEDKNALVLQAAEPGASMILPQQRSVGSLR